MWIVVEVREVLMMTICATYGPYTSAEEAEMRRRERHFDLTQSSAWPNSFKTYTCQVEEMPR
jgi:hypothetical protein